MITANYAVGTGALIVVALDLGAMLGLWIMKLTYRLRFTVLLAAVLTLHVAVILRPDTQPVANLWLLGLSLILFLISLFLPRNDDVPNS